jgi:CBS domain-containing protein
MNPTAQPLSVGELCTRITVIAHRKMGVDEAARLMREHHVGCLVVVEDTLAGRMTVGILTDRDIVITVVAQDLTPAAVTVGDVMSTDLATAREADSVLDALAVMRRRGVRRLPVTDAKGSLIGLITMDDVLGVISEQLRGVVQMIASEQQREQRLRA